jgi:hypothetical protein
MAKIKSILLLFFLYGSVAAAQTGVASITNIQRKGDVVEITITCSEHLHAGANPYVLHIDDQVFMKSQEPQNGEGRALVFYVPATEYSELPNGSEAILVYGYHHENTESKNTEGKEFVGKHWQLGKLNKAMFDK